MDDVLDAPMIIRHSLRHLLLAILACLPLFAQDNPEEEAAPPAFEEAVPITMPVNIKGGQKDLRLELVIHRWSDGGEQDEDGQRFTVSIKEQPAFMENVRWEEGPEIEFAPGEHSKILLLIFDTANSGATGRATEEAQLVLLIEARHEAVIPPERELEIPLLFTRALQPGNSAISVCVIRDDAPEDFPAEDAIDFCDPEPQREPTEYDRVAVFVTPPYSITEPLDESDPFMFEVRGPNGNQLGSGTFGPRLENSTPLAKDGSPGRFAMVFDLWRRTDNPDPAAARTGPGTYTVQSVAGAYSGSSTFGQGDTTVITATIGKDENGEPIHAEWEELGTFEVRSMRLHFQGFVMESVDDVWLPDREDIWEGKLNVQRPQVNGSTVTLGADAWIRKAHIDGYGRRPEEEVHRTSTQAVIEFPNELAPGHKEMGEIHTTVRPGDEQSEEYLFTAGMHLMIPTTQTPPDRFLVENGAVPAIWANEGSFPDDYCNFQATGQERFTSHDRTGDMAKWVWQRTPLQFGCDEKETAELDVYTVLLGGDKEVRAGDPARSLLAHLGEPDTRWIIPVFINLTDERQVRGAGRTLEMKIYGYAVYGAEPGTYDGPPPTGSPPVGDGPDETPPGEEISETTPDHDGEETTPTTTATGTGPETGPDTTVQPPPPIDASNPAGLDPDRQPRVGDLVREWLAIAQPPENAVPGNSFRYDQFGRKVGGGTEGRVIRTRPDVEYGSGPSPAARVWEELRTKLDSIDHCVLEEYVVARLQDSPIDHCAGRYGAVKDLSGFPLDAARSEVYSAGFSSTVNLGDQAPTPDFNGTVQRQEPAPTQHIRRGREVTLIIYTPFVSSAILAPDVVDIPAVEARMQIVELGLTPVPEGGSPARSPAEAGMVESQKPEPQTPLQAGDTVKYRVRGPYVSTQTIPSVIDMTLADATTALTAAGIAPSEILSETGSSAPTAALTGRVEAQEPAPGWAIVSGTRVRLILYRDFIDLRTVPSILGIPEATARERLSAAGFQVQVAENEAAPGRSTAGTVYRQSPQGQTRARAGSVVYISTYLPFVEPPRSVINTNTVNRNTGNPPLQCPNSVTTTQPLGGSSNPIPSGVRLPLDNNNSGFDYHDSSRIAFFECSYGAQGITVTLARATWVPPDATQYYQDFCGLNFSLPGIDTTYSRSHRAKVEAFYNALDHSVATQTAGGFLPILENYAKECGGGGIVSPPPPVPPTPPTPPKPPPPATPTAPSLCPGPDAPHAYDLHIFGAYAGIVNLCRDRSDNIWVNLSNNIYPVLRIDWGNKDPNSDCWHGTTLQLPNQSPSGMLCRIAP